MRWFYEKSCWFCSARRIFVIYTHCCYPWGKNSILTQAWSLYISLKPKQIDIFFFPLTENLQSELRGKDHIHEHYQISIYYSYFPCSTRDLSAYKSTEKMRAHCLREDSRDMPPCNSSYSLQVSNFQVHGTVTYRQDQEGWVVVYFPN